MTEQYITLQEAAALEETEWKKYVNQISYLEKKGNICTKNGQNPETGKPCKLIPLSALSLQAQEKYQKSRVDPLVATILERDREEKLAGQEVPWYVENDPAWYMEKYSKNYYEAVERRRIVEDFLNYQGKSRTIYARHYAREYLNASSRTLFRMVQDYQTAMLWKQKLEAEKGMSCEYFLILALARKPTEHGRFPSIPDQMKAFIRAVWFDKGFAQNRNSVQTLYEYLEELAEERKLGRVPSYSTVQRYVTFLMQEGIGQSAHDYQKKGARDWRNQNMRKTIRDTRSLKVMELVQGDEHTFDCWVAYRHPNGEVTPIRPKLVAWIDIRTRTILGDVVVKEANSAVLKTSVLKMIFQEHGGVPKYLNIDNGKDYTARTMTGKHRNDRSDTVREVPEDELKLYQENELAFDDQVLGFYRSIGIESIHRSKPYQPWSKGEVERFFGTVCGKFSKRFSSYTGTLTGSKTDAKVPKDIQEMFRRGELLTMEEFTEEWQKWLEKYHHRKHSSLVKAGEEYKTPYDLWEHAEHYEHLLPAKSDCTFLMMKVQEALYQTSGIHRFGTFYSSEELDCCINKKVQIRYDPLDVSTLYVFDIRTGKYLGQAVSQELIGMGDHINEKALLEHCRSQKKQEKEVREFLAHVRYPFEEMNEAYGSYQEVFGGLEIGKKAKRKQNIVSMPRNPAARDRRFREDIREEPQENFLQQEGLKAMKELLELEAANK